MNYPEIAWREINLGRGMQNHTTMSPRMVDTAFCTRNRPLCEFHDTSHEIERGPTHGALSWTENLLKRVQVGEQPPCPVVRAKRVSRSVRLPVMSCLTQSLRPTDMSRSMLGSRVLYLGTWSPTVAFSCSLTTALGISPQLYSCACSFLCRAPHFSTPCQENHLRETDRLNARHNISHDQLF